MHGDKSQGQRERALARFERGDIDTLVATDVAARGIDVADITHVIKFDAPGDRDAYVHRVGRTGRAGQTGAGVSFVLGDQRGEMRKIAHDLGLQREFDQGRRRAQRAFQRLGSDQERLLAQRPATGNRRRNRNRSRSRAR